MRFLSRPEVRRSHTRVLKTVIVGPSGRAAPRQERRRTKSHTSITHILPLTSLVGSATK